MGAGWRSRTAHTRSAAAASAARASTSWTSPGGARLGVARVGRHAWLTVGWVSPDRVVAVAGEGSGRQRLLWVDAGTRKVVARRAFSGRTVNTLAVPGGAAVVLGPEEGVGPVRILIVDPSGGVRTISVDGIKAGADYAERTGAGADPGSDGRSATAAASTSWPPGGCSSPRSRLATGAVSYHSLGASAAKGDISVWWRDAAWTGDGRIAVTGDHWPRPRGRLPDGPIPFGVRVIDTRTWTIATLDPRPDTMHVAGGMVLAAGTRYFDAGERSTSTGLLAFDGSGRRAWTRFRGRRSCCSGAAASSGTSGSGARGRPTCSTWTAAARSTKSAPAAGRPIFCRRRRIAPCARPCSASRPRIRASPRS